MMGQKTAQPKLYISISLDAAVPVDHILRKIAASEHDSQVVGRMLDRHGGAVGRLGQGA